MSLITPVIPPQFAPVTGDGAVTFSAYSGFAADTTDAYAAGTFSAYSGAAESDETGDGAGTFSAYAGNAFGSDGDGTNYSIGDGVFSAYSSYAEADMLAPQWGVSDGVFIDYAGWATGLSGYVGVSNGVFSAYQGFADNTGNAFGAGTFSAYSGEAFDLGTIAPVHASNTLPSLTLISFGYSPVIVDPNGNPTTYGLHAVLPSLQLVAYGGASLKKALPKLHLTTAGVVTELAALAAPLPTLRLTAVGIVTTVGRLHADLPAPVTLVSYGSGVLRKALPTLTLTAVAFAGRIGILNKKLPRLTLTAAGIVGTVGTVNAVLPRLGLVRAGLLVATLPRLTLRAYGQEDVTVEYEAYSIALLPENGTAVTHYTNYPFDRFVRFGSKYYGVAADGLYELGANDFNGAPIVSTFSTAETDFGKPVLKRAVALYLGGRVGADMDVSVVSAELNTNTYTYRPISKEGALTHRVTFGKGIRARYMSFTFTNTDGEDFAVDDMAPEIAELRRTV